MNLEDGISLYLRGLLLVLVVCVIELTWTWLHLRYLKARQNKVSFDFTKEVTLGYAPWSHLYQMAGTGFCVWFFILVLSEQTPIRAKCIDVVMIILVLFFTIITLLPRLRARVVIGVGRQLLYSDGYRNEIIYSNQIAGYSCRTYYYYITKNDGNELKIPTALNRSEIIMAFLEDAIASIH